MNRLPSLNILKVFAAAAEHLSFKLAANELCISPPAVSHQIRVLEKQLNTDLFKRLNRSIELTPQGKNYHLKVRQALAILQAASDELINDQQAPSFNISCIPFITNSLLIPHIQSFKDSSANLSVKISSQTQRVELSKGQVDVAIRHKKGDEADLHYESLSRIQVSPICSQAYWDNIPKEKQNDMTSHKIISLSIGDDSWPYWLKQWQYKQAPTTTLSLDNYQAVMTSVKQGLGLAMGFQPAINLDLLDESIIMPFAHQVSDFGEIYLVYRIQNQDRPEIVAFQSWLKGLISQLNSALDLELNSGK